MKRGDVSQFFHVTDAKSVGSKNLNHLLKSFSWLQHLRFAYGKQIRPAKCWTNVGNAEVGAKIPLEPAGFLPTPQGLFPIKTWQPRLVHIILQAISQDHTAAKATEDAGPQGTWLALAASQKVD